MSKNLVIIFVLLFAVSAFAQNKFEGYNIIVDATDNQTSTSCAIRYAPPTTQITITDTDRSTPMKVSACGESPNTVRAVNAFTATITANTSTSKWCFQGEDKRYRINFAGDSSMPQVVYDWIASSANEGVYNVKDFGAIGDGTTDDTIALRSALAYVATRNGGILNFPNGDYSIGNTHNFKGLTLPSGVIISGVSGIGSNTATNNAVQKAPTRISLNGTNRAIFRIGECTERIQVKNIELFANSNENTYGVEAVGGYNSSQDFEFNQVSFSNMFRGIYAHGLESSNYNWQFDYVRVTNCRFNFVRDAGIWCRVRNSDWKIIGTFFVNPKRTPNSKADSMHFHHSAAILIEDTYSGGFSGALGGTFLSIIDGGSLTVISSQCESMTNSMVYGDLQGAGDYTYPITFIGSIFGDPIIFKARRTFVSNGNLYLGNPFKMDEQVRVYSNGDRFNYDGYIVPGQTPIKKFDNASVIFQTGQPSEGSVKGHPTFFGTDVQFGQPIQLPSLQQNALPSGKPNGSMVYCENCRRNSTPCQAGGSGSPAMIVNGTWSCL
jgi:Pectate lyase superfamily protein